MNTRGMALFLATGLLLAVGFVPGCDEKKDPGITPEHEALIKEFEGFETEQCACQDYACSQALGQKVGPKVEEVMNQAESYPQEVQLRLLAILKKMTDCANRTKEP